MGQNCRLTCQLCTPSPPTTLSPAQCYDSLPSCSYSAFLCNYTLYLTFMSQNCPVTCGLCVPLATTKDPCSDKSLIPNLPSNCSAFSSLCTISVFQAIMTEYCPKTCGFCTSTISPGATSTSPLALG
uniref:ShKT domain-containing protein n=1 Tax=Acrobeloides nanus TaxID=290746 RepID=A0A914BZ13_9BILA